MQITNAASTERSVFVAPRQEPARSCVVRCSMYQLFAVRRWAVPGGGHAGSSGSAPLVPLRRATEPPHPPSCDGLHAHGLLATRPAIVTVTATAPVTDTDCALTGTASLRPSRILGTGRCPQGYHWDSWVPSLRRTGIHAGTCLTGLAETPRTLGDGGVSARGRPGALTDPRDSPVTSWTVVKVWCPLDPCG